MIKDNSIYYIYKDISENRSYNGCKPYFNSFIDTNNDGILDTATLSNSFVGYAPFDNPKMSIVVVSPNIVDVSGYNGLSGRKDRRRDSIWRYYCWS